MQHNQSFFNFSAVRYCGFLLVAALFILSIAVSAYAHATVLWCYVENNRVYVEAFFMGGKKVQEGKIYVLDQNGKKVLEGVTDKEGLFNFAPPSQDDMTIVLLIDTGHGTEFKLTKQDFLEAAQEGASAEK